MDLSSILNFSVAGITINKILSAIILLVVCLIVVKLLLKIADKAMERMNLDNSLRTFIRTAAKLGLLFLTILIVAGSLGINVTSLIAVLSVFGLAVSLAVQNSLSNVAGGIQLLTSKPFKAGDYVEAGGIEGIVQDVGIFYTRIHTWDNKLIQVPNSQISAEKIINYTAEPVRRVDLTFNVSYNTPVETVQKAMKDAMSAHPLTLDEPDMPFARVSKYGESTIEYTLRVWCKTEDYWTVYFDMIEQVKESFAKNGVELSYPHVNVHMVQQ